jgi:hypothetical protein
MLGTILLDWKGLNVRKDPTETGGIYVYAGKGEPLPYSEHCAREILSKSEVIRNFVSEKARQIENFARRQPCGASSL